MLRTRTILTLCFFTVAIISTVSDEVIHFRSNMDYVPDEVSERDYISDEDLLKAVENIEQQQQQRRWVVLAGVKDFFNIKRVPFREKTAKSYTNVLPSKVGKPTKYLSRWTKEHYKSL